jgi:hypothetical protein
MEVDFNASTGQCAAPFYTSSPGLFSGWSTGDFAQVSAAVLGMLAIAFIIQIVIRWAEKE